MVFTMSDLVILCLVRKIETISASTKRLPERSVLEVSSLLFQGSMWKTDTFRVVMNFSYFLIQFLFLLRATELIISPRAQIFANSLVTLLDRGYKFLHPSVFPKGTSDEYAALKINQE